MTQSIWDLGICRIRPFRIGDAPSIAAEANDREVWINLRDRFPHPYTLEDASGWLGHVVEVGPPTEFAVEVDGRAIGAVGLTLGGDVFRRSAEIGYWLGRAWWGRGIASAAVAAITAHGFAEFDLIRVHAGVFAWNPASARVLEKAGYAFEGRLRAAVTKAGRTVDQLVYAITADQGRGSSDESSPSNRGRGGGTEAGIGR